MSDFSTNGIGGYQSLSEISDRDVGIDLHEYDDLLHRLYGALSHAQGFHPFLENLRSLFRCDTATIGIRDRKTRRILGGWFCMPSEQVRWYMANMSHRDPLLNLAEEAKKPGFCATNLDFTQHLDLKEQTVEEWREVAQLQHGASCLVHRDSETHSFLTVARKGEFSRAEIALLDRFIPHVRRVLELHNMMLSAPQSIQPLLAAFNRLSHPLLICNNRSQVTFQNLASEKWLAQNSWFRLENNFVHLQDQHLHAKLSIDLNSVIQASRTLQNNSDQVLSFAPGKAGNDQGITVVISALDGVGGHTNACIQGGGAMISLHPWLTTQTVSKRALATAFALSPAEVRVCQLLCQGQELKAIAQQLNRGTGTIRSQLKSIYRKTGTSRQAQLVALVLNTLNHA